MLNCCKNPGFGWTSCPVSGLPGRLSSTGSADLRDETSFGKRRFYRWAQLNCNSGTDGTDGVLPGTLSPVPHLTWPPQSVEGLSGFPAGGDPYRSFKGSQKQLHQPGHRSHPALISDSLDSSRHETKSLCSSREGNFGSDPAAENVFQVKKNAPVPRWRISFGSALGQFAEMWPRFSRNPG